MSISLMAHTTIFRISHLPIRSSFHLKFLQQNLHHVTLAGSLMAIDEDGGVTVLVRLQEQNSAPIKNKVPLKTKRFLRQGNNHHKVCNIKICCGQQVSIFVAGNQH